ncbi:Origin recognition complex subunit 2 [Eumeta japonica]|uniref:Origin recognition complex subunit 2 n=1 Tax=Eumeta variegata TaxID=151549 RepID=A0A4C1YUX6_EUMVA|nr:Origin recognition complex subunit 2 [Eumeta japonica]
MERGSKEDSVSDCQESDFSDSDSDSDFVPDTDEDDSESSSTEKEENGDSDHDSSKTPKHLIFLKTDFLKFKPAHSPGHVLTPDKYFLMNSCKKNTVRAAGKVKQFNIHFVDSEGTQESEEHKNKIKDLNKSYEKLFSWWFSDLIEVETSYETSLTQASGGSQLASLRSVYRSLTANAKGIFKIIVQHRLDSQKAPYQGIPFKELYSKSREQFVASSDTALRSQLTEFVDHRIIKMKRTIDGSENVVLILDSNVIQQFMAEQDL